MKIEDLITAMEKAVADGHGDADIVVIGGTGKATIISGWQLVTSSGFDHDRDRSASLSGQQLRLYTGSRF